MAANNGQAPVAIDILLPVHGGLLLTLQCIRSLYAYTRTPFHLIVLDDTDATLRQGAFHRIDPTDVTSDYFGRLIKKYNNITYINRGQPYRNGNEFFNEGFKYCRYDYVACVMNSMTVEPNWETVGLQVMTQQSDVGVIGFKCLFPNGLIESAGIVFNNFTPCDYGRDDPGHWHCDVREMPAVQWAFALLRKRAVVGVLDDTFNGFVGWDDIDNCFAVHSKGWRIIYCGRGVGIHQPRATRGSNDITSHLLNQQNAHKFYQRWGFWEQYKEANKLDVSYRLNPNIKEALSDCIVEIQVLQNLLKRQEERRQELFVEALKDLGVERNKYTMEVNPLANLWALKLKDGTEPMEAAVATK